MSIDDIIYVTCLLTCIGAGNYLRKIPDKGQQKLLSTGFGFLMVFIVSGWNSLHCFVSAAIGAASVVYVHPRNCHLVAFVVMFGYLVFFRLSSMFGLPDPPGHTNMIQMILTLKVAGVGFEKTAAWKRIREQNKKDDDKEDISKFDEDIQSISLVEIFHYAFNYIGVLTGPYYRYRTYRDYFETSFAQYAPNVQATMDKLKSAGVFCALYLCTNYIWPLEYALSDEFYNQRSVFYRLMYVWPTFFIFRMRMYTGLTLSECVCTMAGFGAYPDEADVVNGEGPRKPYLHLKPETYKGTYNFTTIVNTRVEDVEKCITFREAMKHWNICVQYWLAVNVYKLFPSKKYRTAVTLFCSAFWHGFRPGYYMCIMGAPIYAPIEDFWNKLIRTDATGNNRRMVDINFWIFKMFTISYLGTAFLMETFQKIWKFYSSVYHIGYICWVILLVGGFILDKQKNAFENRKKRLEENKHVGISLGVRPKTLTTVTLLCSAGWHGFRPGHYFCIMGAPFYVPVEDMWNKLIRKDATGAVRQLLDVVFWIFKFFAYSYMGTAFLLVSFGNIWKFYSSIYHIGYITWFVFMVVGIILTKQKKAAEKRKKRLDGSKAVVGGDTVEISSQEDNKKAL